MILKLLLLVCSILAPSSGSPVTPEVHAALYGTVTLPCTFPFVRSLTDLTVIWKRMGNQRESVLYKVLIGKERPEEQDPRYRGRVELSKDDVTRGDLHLTLRNVTYQDEGTYQCQAANRQRNGNKMAALSIDKLDADPTTVTMVTIDQEKWMKCIGRGHYYSPQIQWITTGGKDLSIYGRQNVTERSNGQTLVESVLHYPLEADVQVLCHISEGRLRRSARAVISGDCPRWDHVLMEGLMAESLRLLIRNQEILGTELSPRRERRPDGANPDVSKLYPGGTRDLSAESKVHHTRFNMTY